MLKIKIGSCFSIMVLTIIFWGCKNTAPESQNTNVATTFFKVTNVEVNDAFWSPKLDLWQNKTVLDVFDKFEGKYTPEGPSLEKDFKTLGVTRNAFENFDLVAQGKRGIGIHHGPPWYDGLIYETIRGSADLLAHHRDAKLEERIDGYIDRIAAAQSSDPDGYLNTYTQLMEPDHRWGFKGGMLRWQHDVYNAGMLVEAGVHYYKATGKTKLLNVAVKFANYMCDDIGPSPKKNVVPAHSGPEEALIKLYQLFRDEADLKTKIDVRLDENDYFELAKFWIENRGHHVGLPLWRQWGNEKAEQWIKEVHYDDPKYGNHSRPTWGDYAQDSIPVLQQKTIEGHAVRATLLATGLTTAAIENNDPQYTKTAHDLWDNMVGKRMFITGGVGAIAHDEKFGSDYYLPNDSYLETCAAVGAGFFSQRMNQLTRDGKYMDEFERVLYNNVLTGISLSGDQYTYQNPLDAEHHHRWNWHDCPCCPPMFLKMISAVPDFIYASNPEGIDVNLYIGSKVDITMKESHHIELIQETNYPWSGTIKITVNPDAEYEFMIKVRLPGWAQGVENPLGLYQTNFKADLLLTVNGIPWQAEPVDGYLWIKRSWQKGDKIELILPMQPRLISAHVKVTDLKGLVALASGPLIFCLENNLNDNLSAMNISTSAPMEISYDANLLNGMNVITGQAKVNNALVNFKAIPYFAVGNLQPGDRYKVWMPSSE